jgi:plastocyanin
MSFRPTITFGICVAAGIAAGIGLARPGQIGDTTQAGSAITTTAEQQPAAGPGPYGSAPADSAGTTGTGQAPPAAITIANFAFGDPITAAPGAAVEVTNSDGDTHTVTAEGAAFDTGSISGGGAASFVAPTEPGTYTFFCSIHPSMQGALSITG